MRRGLMAACLAVKLPDWHAVPASAACKVFAIQWPHHIFIDFILGFQSVGAIPWTGVYPWRAEEVAAPHGVTPLLAVAASAATDNFNLLHQIRSYSEARKSPPETLLLWQRTLEDISKGTCYLDKTFSWDEICTHFGGADCFLAAERFGVDGRLDGRARG